MGAEAFVHSGHVSLKQKESEKQLINEDSLLEKVMNELRAEFNSFLS